jgi:hypothetical protein
MRVLAPLCAALFFGAAQPSPVLLREQAWTAAGNLSALLERPGECLAVRTPETEIGRALFRSPALFGGPAARLGLSCESCHTSGRANTHFFLPELTDRAGAADVTSEWASRVRGDGVHNPRDIPDLVDVSRRARLGRDGDASLDHFVAGVIEEEFQGEPLPGEAFGALTAYLRALSAGACANVHTFTLAHATDDVRRALSAAEAAQDSGTKRLLLLATQDSIGRIVERLPAESFTPEQTRLASLARELGSWRSATDLNATLSTAAPGWAARFDAVVARIAPREAQTYFNESTLAAALAP